MPNKSKNTDIMFCRMKQKKPPDMADVRRRREVSYSITAASRISFMTLLVRTLRRTAAVNSAST